MRAKHIDAFLNQMLSPPCGNLIINYTDYLTSRLLFVTLEVARLLFAILRGLNPNFNDLEAGRIIFCAGELNTGSMASWFLDTLRALN
jgi:hypothetical protein